VGQNAAGRQDGEPWWLSAGPNPGAHEEDPCCLLPYLRPGEGLANTTLERGRSSAGGAERVRRLLGRGADQERSRCVGESSDSASEVSDAPTQPGSERITDSGQRISRRKSVCKKLLV